MAPFHPAALGTLIEFFIFLSIGMAFGAVLEMSGFGDSRKLAAQFYLREMTVLKVMFTGIIVAAVLIFLASSLQLIDMQKVWVNPTYLWPGIVGGLVMGVGFVVGGFCPGTSLVAASTLKLDGIAFVLGGLGGVFLFGETVHRFDAWWRSSYLGRFTVDEWLGVPAGVAVLLLVLMALGMFVLAEASERHFGPRSGIADSTGASSTRRPRRVVTRGRLAAAALVGLAAVVAVIGQPDAEARWNWIQGKSGPELAARAIYVAPVEVVDLRKDLSLAVRIIDVRPEDDYNRFHLAGSRRVDPQRTGDQVFLREMQGLPDNQITFLISNGERAATEAWKHLKTQGVINIYVIDGGINGWLDAYPPSPCVAERVSSDRGGADDAPAWRFHVSVGDMIASAQPEKLSHAPAPDCPEASVLMTAGGRPSWFNGRNAPERDYVRKVVLQRKVVAKGGCG